MPASDEVRGYIDQLIAHGLLQQTEDQYPILQLTADGVAAMKDPAAAGDLVAVATAPGRARPCAAGADRGRRRGRASIAACSSGCGRCASRLPVRAACRRTSSFTIRRCASWRARSRDRWPSCERVYGMGARKIEALGAVVLETIRAAD